MFECPQHPEFECLFINLKERNDSTFLLCEMCIQEQTDTSAFNLISLNVLKSDSFNQYQKLLKFADEGMILLPFIKFNLIKDGVLNQINMFYNELSSTLQSFVEQKREQTIKCYNTLNEAQEKLYNLSKLDELKSIIQKSEELDTNNLNVKLKEFFTAQFCQKKEINSYLTDCVKISDQLEFHMKINEQITAIKQKINNVLKLEDEVVQLNELSTKEAKKVQQLQDKIKVLTQQIDKIMKFNSQLNNQNLTLSSEMDGDLYKLDIVNKGKPPNYLMLKIEHAILNNKIFSPIEIIKSEEGLIFSRTLSGDDFIGIIDVPLDFDVYGRPFKIKNLQGIIGIGACARDINVKRGYRCDYKMFSPSFGKIMLYSNGYIHSSFDQAQNKIDSQIYCDVGQVITIIPHDNKISFSNDDQMDDFLFEPEDGVVYSPCFMLTQDSSIEFLIE